MIHPGIRELSSEEDADLRQIVRRIRKRDEDVIRRTHPYKKFREPGSPFKKAPFLRRQRIPAHLASDIYEAYGRAGDIEVEQGARSRIQKLKMWPKKLRGEMPMALLPLQPGGDLSRVVTGEELSTDREYKNISPETANVLMALYYNPPYNYLEGREKNRGEVVSTKAKKLVKSGIEDLHEASLEPAPENYIPHAINLATARAKWGGAYQRNYSADRAKLLELQGVDLLRYKQKLDKRRIRTKRRGEGGPIRTFLDLPAYPGRTEEEKRANFTQLMRWNTRDRHIIQNQNSTPEQVGIARERMAKRKGVLDAYFREYAGRIIELESPSVARRRKKSPQLQRVSSTPSPRPSPPSPPPPPPPSPSGGASPPGSRGGGGSKRGSPSPPSRGSFGSGGEYGGGGGGGGGGFEGMSPTALPTTPRAMSRSPSPVTARRTPPPALRSRHSPAPFERQRDLSFDTLRNLPPPPTPSLPPLALETLSKRKTTKRKKRPSPKKRPSTIVMRGSPPKKQPAQTKPTSKKKKSAVKRKKAVSRRRLVVGTPPSVHSSSSPLSPSRRSAESSVSFSPSTSFVIPLLPISERPKRATAVATTTPTKTTTATSKRPPSTSKIVIRGRDIQIRPGRSFSRGITTTTIRPPSRTREPSTTFFQTPGMTTYRPGVLGTKTTTISTGRKRKRPTTPAYPQQQQLRGKTATTTTTTKTTVRSTRPIAKKRVPTWKDGPPLSPKPPLPSIRGYYKSGRTQFYPTQVGYGGGHGELVRSAQIYRKWFPNVTPPSPTRRRGRRVDTYPVRKRYALARGWEPQTKLSPLRKRSPVLLDLRTPPPGTGRRSPSPPLSFRAMTPAPKRSPVRPRVGRRSSTPWTKVTPGRKRAAHLKAGVALKSAAVHKRI